MNDQPKKSPAEAGIEEALRQALIYNDRMNLPRVDAKEVCATNAELEALYTPWYRDLHAFLQGAILAHVLIRVTEVSPRLANEIAHEVQEWCDAGDTYPEWIWEWANERGMDPDALVAKAKADTAEWLTQPFPAPAPVKQNPEANPTS